MSYTIDIDTGGTFTDGGFVDRSRVRTVKVPTTPHDLTLCFLECITAGARQLEVSVEDMLVNTDVIRFSTTIGTNTLIERNGTKVGLLVSRGEEGTLQVTGEAGEESPLVHPEMVRTLKGSVTEDGRVIEAVDRDEALQAAQQLLDDGARCLVVSLKNSAYNAAQEQQVRTWIKEEYPRDYLGSVPVFLSSDITNLPGNRERTNAAVLNAYIHARLVKFLYKAGEDLRKRFYNRPLLIVHATGGVARVAKTKAINTYNSGPAAGLMGAAALGRLYGIKDLVSGDMGGTSFDMGVVRNGQPNFTLRPEVEGLPLATPMVAIRAIGAGGGSIATVRRGKLQVGPQSAGALPGPACFDLGGINATVTDADVVLGYIDPAYYLGGAMKLDRKKAAEAIATQVGSALGLDLISAALAIRDGVDMSMGTELKAVVDSASKDLNPVLAIYGGAGSAHCCGLAEHAGIKKIIAPRFASVFSASALSGMDVWHICSRRLGVWLKQEACMTANGSVVTDAIAAMYAEAARDMRGEGFDETQVSYQVEFFLSQGGDAPEGRVVLEGFDWKDLLAAALEKQSARLAAAPKLFSPVIFLHAKAPIRHYETTSQALQGPSPEGAYRGSRPVCWSAKAGMVDTPLYDRLKLAPGNQVKGPAVVEALDTTYVVRPRWTFAVDVFGNGVFEEVTQ
jgi:N-methylhydantoinase A/acetophenone carboxylase